MSSRLAKRSALRARGSIAWAKAAYPTASHRTSRSTRAECASAKAVATHPPSEFPISETRSIFSSVKNPVEKIDKCAHTIIKQRLIGVTESDLIKRDDPESCRQRRYH